MRLSSKPLKPSPSLLTFSFLVLTSCASALQFAQVELIDKYTTTDKEVKIFQSPFILDRTLNPAPFSQDVPLIWLDVGDESCDILLDNMPEKSKRPNHFAIFLSLPQDCSLQSSILALQLEGADFLLIHQEEIAFNGVSDQGMSIPVFLFNNTEDPLIQAIQKIDKAHKGKDIQLSIAIPPMIAKASKATVEFFYSPAQENAYRYIPLLKKAVNKLRGYVDFEPVVVSASFPVVKDYSNCLSKGRYCSVQEPGEKGRTEMQLGLFQKCAFLHEKLEWFDLVAQSKTDCIPSLKKDCHLKFVPDAKQTLKQCIEPTRTSRDKPQPEYTVLEDDQAKLHSRDLHYFPSLYVNGQLDEGPQDARYILEAMCNGLDTEVGVCHRNYLDLHYADPMPKYLRFGKLVGAFVLILVAVAFATACFQLRKGRALQDKLVKQRIDDYYLLGKDRRSKSKLGPMEEEALKASRMKLGLKKIPQLNLENSRIESVISGDMMSVGNATFYNDTEGNMNNSGALSPGFQKVNSDFGDDSDSSSHNSPKLGPRRKNSEKVTRMSVFSRGSDNSDNKPMVRPSSPSVFKKRELPSNYKPKSRKVDDAGMRASVSEDEKTDDEGLPNFEVEKARED